MDIFSAEKRKTLKIYYLDTPSKEFKGAGFQHRIRLYKDEKKFDITYKKQLPGSLDAAIAEAEAHGFSGDESNYKFEVDAKGGERIFTISRKEKFKVTPALSYEAFDSEAAKKLFIDNVPKKIEAWYGSVLYRQAMEQATVFGPAEAATYEGSYLGYVADIEVWNKQGDQIVEISTKEQNAVKAEEIEALWRTNLQEAGYLSDDQSGKTDFIMGN
ncbi:hypothetical protein QR721_10515 [Aciduricibacillus chroicocephali]|uniref:CYTH domain-containing protein n=1 Tax=Aciduricibacillus chroicocephali TaxID=3054939 RepID=A0ABY9KU59_9BACI|nr:hypothetical protein QR721_10515 [Bacillaceae bacterium 44XB]